MGEKTGTEIFSIPKDPKEAAELIAQKTQEVGMPPFWRLNKGTIFRPPGTRKFPEVAVLVHEDVTVRNDFMMLKYKDGTSVPIAHGDLYKGHGIHPTDVTEKWVVAKKGERNLRGRVIE